MLQSDPERRQEGGIEKEWEVGEDDGTNQTGDKEGRAIGSWKSWHSLQRTVSHVLLTMKETAALLRFPLLGLRPRVAELVSLGWSFRIMFLKGLGMLLMLRKQWLHFENHHVATCPGKIGTKLKDDN